MSLTVFFLVAVRKPEMDHMFVHSFLCIVVNVVVYSGEVVVCVKWVCGWWWWLLLFYSIRNEAILAGDDGAGQKVMRLGVFGKLRPRKRRPKTSKTKTSKTKTSKTKTSKTKTSKAKASKTRVSYNFCHLNTNFLYQHV